MIGEAVDAAVTLGWALAAWIVIAAVAVTAAGYALVGLLWLVGRWAWKGARRAWKAARTRAHGPEAEREPRNAHDTPGARTGPHDWKAAT